MSKYTVVEAFVVLDEDENVLDYFDTEEDAEFYVEVLENKS